MFKKRASYLYFSLAVCTLTTFLYVIFFSEETTSSLEKTLIVGLNSAYPPFEYIDEQGKLIGFDIDIAQRIASALDRKLVIKDMDFDGEILSLKQGKIDIILSGMQITPSRDKEIILVPYHGETATSLSLIFWKQIPYNIHSLEDLEYLPEAIVSVGTGTVSEVFLTQYPQIHTKSFEGALDPLLDVKFGKSIANLVETDVAEYLQQKYPEIKLLSIPVTNTPILGFGIGINKKNQALAIQIQKIIQTLKESDELKILEERWFSRKVQEKKYE